MQRNWIGRSEGAEVTFHEPETGRDYSVFTTRPDTLFGATFFVMAPEHPDVLRLAAGTEHEQAVKDYVNGVLSESREDRADTERTKTGVPLGRSVVNPAQEAGDVLGANEVFMDAFYTDVRADLAAWREGRGLPGNPIAAYRASGYQEQIEADRVGGLPRQDGTDDEHDFPERDRQPDGERLRRPLEPARRRPEEHQLRRRQHLRQGQRGRSRHRRAGRAVCRSRVPVAISAR